MHFADATPADLPGLAALINAAYRPPGATPGWTDERGLLDGPRTDEAMLRADLAASRILVLRLAPGGSIVGCLGISGDHGRAWHLSTVAVDPARQGSGWGAALLAEAER